MIYGSGGSFAGGSCSASGAHPIEVQRGVEQHGAAELPLGQRALSPICVLAVDRCDRFVPIQTEESVDLLERLQTTRVASARGDWSGYRAEARTERCRAETSCMSGL